MPPGPTLDGEARLEERERPGEGVRSSMQNPVALGAKRSADSVKGGIARAPGLPEKHDMRHEKGSRVVVPHLPYALW